MSKVFKAYPNMKDVESVNDDEFEDNILLDEDEELEAQYVRGGSKEHKRNNDAKINKTNKWKIKG